MNSTAVTPELIVRAVLELLFLLAILGALLFFTDLRKRLFPLGAAALTVVLVFVGAWGIVQMVDRWQYDYPQKVSFVPLTRFAMYQAQLDESVEATYSWQAKLVDGTEREVNIASEFSSVGLPPLSTRMRVMLDWIQDDEPSDRPTQAKTELTMYAEGLLRALDSDGEEVMSIGFYRVTGTPGDVEAESLITWTATELEGK